MATAPLVSVDCVTVLPTHMISCLYALFVLTIYLLVSRTVTERIRTNRSQATTLRHSLRSKHRQPQGQNI